MPARPAMSFLLQELIQAHQRARAPELQACLSACRMLTDGPVWGLDFIAFHALSYEPSPDDGEAALIQQSCEDGLVDLVACRLRDRRIATRVGNARALGEDWINLAVLQGIRLPLHSDPLRWLVRGRRGAVIVDWWCAASLLDGVMAVTCDCRSLAKRVHAATRRMHRPPRIHLVHHRS